MKDIHAHNVYVQAVATASPAMEAPPAWQREENTPPVDANGSASQDDIVDALDIHVELPGDSHDLRLDIFLFLGKICPDMRL